MTAHSRGPLDEALLTICFVVVVVGIGWELISWAIHTVADFGIILRF